MTSCQSGSRAVVNEKHPPATREVHDQFCENEEWTLVRGATGKPVTHHRTYELVLWDGRILRTRISRPVDKTEYAASMWSHILRYQLELAAEAFWACAMSSVRPDRGEPQSLDMKKAIPLFLREALRERGVDDATILALDPAGAASLLAEKYTAEQASDD